MIIINHKEKKLSIVHSRVNDDEDKGYLIEAIVAAIRWNSLCDDGAKYNVNRVDAMNVYVLTELLLTIMNANDYKNGFTVNIKTTAPLEQFRHLYLAIVACVRWNGIVSDEYKKSDDGNSLQIIACLLEQMSEVKEIK